MYSSPGNHQLKVKTIYSTTLWLGKWCYFIQRGCCFCGAYCLLLLINYSPHTTTRTLFCTWWFFHGLNREMCNTPSWQIRSDMLFPGKPHQLFPTTQPLQECISTLLPREYMKMEMGSGRVSYGCHLSTTRYCAIVQIAIQSLLGEVDKSWSTVRPSVEEFCPYVAYDCGTVSCCH